MKYIGCGRSVHSSLVQSQLYAKGSRHQNPQVSGVAFDRVDFLNPLSAVYKLQIRRRSALLMLRAVHSKSTTEITTGFTSRGGSWDECVRKRWSSRRRELSIPNTRFIVTLGNSTFLVISHFWFQSKRPLFSFYFIFCQQSIQTSLAKHPLRRRPTSPVIHTCSGRT